MKLKNFNNFLNESKKKYWTKENCKIEALKYNTRSEYQKNSSSSYNSALKNKWLDEICSHMLKIKNVKNYWTKEKCHEDALKYKIKNDYRYNNSASYLAAKRNGWLDEICSHMISPYKPNDYWTKENCKIEALKYNNRRDFERRSSGAYYASKKNGWFNEICSHMIQFRNEYSGYAYEFDDNCVYIGITSREKRRERTHLKDKMSAVFKHIKETGLTPKKINLFTKDTPEIAAKLEGKWVEYYKNKDWNILNISKTGSLGSNMIKWSYEKCKEEALKYNTRNDFRKNSLAYGTSRKNGWLDNICSHMIVPPKRVYWTFEKCQKESLKYKTLNDFRKNKPGAYGSCLKNKWIHILYPNTIKRNIKK